MKSVWHGIIFIYSFTYLMDDAIGRLLRDLLIDKARQGVKIRLLYDDVGCWRVDSMFYDQMLCEGIEVPKRFLKGPFPSIHQ